MAQTKRKRRSKHRGNAAGAVEARGRTGRRPADSEKRSSSPKDERARKAKERASRPPTWRSAVNRGVVAGLIMMPISVLLLHVPLTGTPILLLAVAVFYIPMGYYTDLFIYRRRMRQKTPR
jgi:hypothetical protein